VKKIVAGIAVAAVLFIGAAAWSGYNSLVSLDQAVRAQWGQVENAYQRREDLIPNLVETVKGAASFEKQTYTAVAEARARVGQVSTGGAAKLLEDPEAFKKFEEAQQNLGGALSRLLVVAESYPDLKATAAFRDLQSQLEGTENRITVERMRFNEVAREFNTARRRFPTVLIANMLGFDEKPYFEATEGADRPPTVDFSTPAAAPGS
jgi:LemA protein